MRISALRWIILICSLVVGLLACAQLFWLYRMYKNQEREFNTGVIKSIRGVYEDLEIIRFPIRMNEMVEQTDANTFIFKIDSIPQIDSFRNDIIENLEAFGIFADFSFYLYNEPSGDVYYRGHSRNSDISGDDNVPEKKVLKKPFSYVSLFIIDREKYLFQTMKWWMLISFFLLIALIALAFSIFYLYRQKFLNEVQNDFIRNVTHEFQTPLTTLMVGIDAIARKSKDEKVLQYLQLMSGQISYLKLHLENLMRVLKSEMTGFASEKSQVAPNDLIREAVAHLSAFIDQKKALVHLDLEESNMPIQADRNNLLTAIINLISNAVKFSAQPEISITSGVQDRFYFISVRDNGIGIDEKYQRLLFRKFYRVPTGHIHNVKGLGLGLYLVKKIVAAHGGSIHMKSIQPCGSEFTIYLPIN